MGTEVVLQKETKIPGAHEIGAAISVPRIACGKLWTLGFFERNSSQENPHELNMLWELHSCQRW